MGCRRRGSLRPSQCIGQEVAGRIGQQVWVARVGEGHDECGCTDEGSGRESGKGKRKGRAGLGRDGERMEVERRERERERVRHRTGKKKCGA
jgi:hypothetical protein